MSDQEVKKSEEQLKEEQKPEEVEDSREGKEEENDRDSEFDSDEDDSEYEEIDVTDNPLYQVLSAFFETEEGENMCDIMKDLTDAVRDNTKMMSKLLKDKNKK